MHYSVTSWSLSQLTLDDVGSLAVGGGRSAPQRRSRTGNKQARLSTKTQSGTLLEMQWIALQGYFALVISKVTLRPCWRV